MRMLSPQRSRPIGQVSRWEFRWWLLLALGCVCGLDLAAGTTEARPPNVVLILSDDHAWTDYGFMGHAKIATPHLDRLAARSAVFRHGYVPTALCRPSLVSIITGRYAHQHLVTGNDPALLDEMKSAAKGKKKAGEPPAYAALRETLISRIDKEPSLPRLLGDKGYLSHQSGKWWEGHFSRGGFTHGMTRGFPQPGGRHGDDGLVIGRETMQPVFDFMDSAVKSERPFFVWYAPFLPHTPHNPPDRLFQKYKGMGIASDHVARYYAMVEWFDETCGQLLDHVDRLGQTDNTLVVYLADNGWIQQPDSAGFALGSKQSANEGGVRQPILFSLPGTIRPGIREKELCSSIDIAPTVLSACGAPVPANMAGLNLLPCLTSGDPSPRKEVFGETFGHDIPDLDNPSAGLIYRWLNDGRWKLILTYDGRDDRYSEVHPRDDVRPQLYDLDADPHETRNLAQDHPQRVAEMASRIEAWWPVVGRKVVTRWTQTPTGN